MSTTHSQQVFLPIKFPGLNEYTNANRKNRHIGAKMKYEYTEQVRLLCLRLKPLKYPGEFQFTWVEANTKRDPDNIVFAKKFILDGLVEAGIIPDDNQKWVRSFSERWIINKETSYTQPVGVFVIITELENDNGS
jgi:Holliday junction resolvase RusA-like endonuclease